jgi:hypothetical protein
MANHRRTSDSVQQFLTQYHGGDSYDTEAWSPLNPAAPRHVNTDPQSVASESTPTWDEETNYTYVSQSSRTRTARSASIFSRYSTADQSSVAQSEAPASQWDGYEVAGGEEFVLWCEFHQLNGCHATFRGDNEAAWIQHHIDHLGGRVPSSLVCWFCNEPPFVAKQREDRRANFVDRMQHIRQHISVNWTITSEDMRPDFFMVKKMYRIGQIDRSTYERAMAYNEMPENLRPAADDEPPMTWRSGAVVDNGERERRHHRRHGRN